MANNDGQIQKGTNSEYGSAHSQVIFICSSASRCASQGRVLTNYYSSISTSFPTVNHLVLEGRNIRRSETAPYLSPIKHRSSTERIPKILRRIHISDQAFSHFDANLQPGQRYYYFSPRLYRPYPKLLKCTHNN
jgi:hypothetical protein